MNVYLDSSVILRLLLKEQEQLANWTEFDKRVSSALTEVECLRTLDRAHINYNLTQQEIIRLRESLFQLFEAMDIIDLTRSVLEKAAEAMPVVIGTLDAIHLATALEWQLENSKSIVMCTHDKTLANAAAACGLKVIGI